MDSPSVGPDIEAQANSVTGTQSLVIPNPPPTANTADQQLPISAEADPQPQATNTNQDHDGSPPGQPPANSQVQLDENHGDSSDGLWSMYLTEAEKLDTEVTESWKGDTDGILVFTGLFSATIAAFIIESYKQLSPDSSDKTNALLTQISQQMVNMSNGAPLTIVVAESSQPFKLSASAIRVNMLWFLSIILSLTCALSATLMQQWARRYLELARRRGAFHRCGRMRSYIFDGIDRFGLARAVATMPTLLHISVFLFFTGLVEFLFPIYATVAYTSLSCIVVFALAYATLMILPNIYLNCPYATPLSGLTWRVSQFSVIVFLWTILKIEGLYKLLHLGTRNPTNPTSSTFPLTPFPRRQHTPGHEGPKTWRETLENQVKIRRLWFSQGIRKSVELSAYGAESTVVTSALVWTLTALDEDKEIEDFAARVPGFFDSRVVPDATLAVLPLMSHQPNTDPIFGPRLYDLLKTCMPSSSILDENMRKKRLRVCMKCMWSFAKAYNELESSQLLPSYFFDTLASPEITDLVRTEEDPDVRIIARCSWALIVNKLVVDLNPLSDQISNGKLECLSAILRINVDAVKPLLLHPGTITLMNMISLMFDDFGGLATEKVPSGALIVVQQTLDILSRAASSQWNAEMGLYQPITIISGSDGNFERILLSRLPDFLDTCVQVTSPLARERTSYLQMGLKGLWHFVRALNQFMDPFPLLRCVCKALTNPDITRHIRMERDHSVHVIRRCAVALVANKVAADLKSHRLLNNPDPSNDDIASYNDELESLSAILDTDRDNVVRLLNLPGAIEFTNTLLFLLDDTDHVSYYGAMPSYVLDMIQQTATAQFLALPPELNARMQLNQTERLMNGLSGTIDVTIERYKSILRVWMKSLWDFTKEYCEPGNSVSLPSYIRVAFANPDMARRIHQADGVSCMIGRCIGALIINKLIPDAMSRTDSVSDAELATLSAILGTESHDVRLWLGQPGIMKLINIVSLAFGDASYMWVNQLPSDMGPELHQTLAILFQALPSQGHPELPLDLTVSLTGLSDAKFEPTAVSLFHGLLKLCIPGASSLTEVRISCLRMCLKTLWICAKASNRTYSRLPSYFPLKLSSPELTRHLHTERDPVARITGHCFGALIVNKIVSTLRLPISFNDGVRDSERACILAILDTEHCEDLRSRHQLRVINLRNLVSAMSGEDNTLSAAAGMSPGVLNIAQATLYDLAGGFLDCHPFASVEEIYREVTEALNSGRFKNETVKTLYKLRQTLEKPLPRL